MSETKPLHVQVAEALGMQPCVKWRHFNATSSILGKGECDHEWGKCYPAGACPQYDTAWAATGPLIERFGITLTHDSGAGPWIAEVPGVEWYPEATPLLAVCRCILELHASGKLRDATEEGKPEL